MREETRKKRHQTIADAAYKLLEEKGYSGTSMLGVAKAAKASNETLYRWYGDKRGLFEALARDNAQQIKVNLEEAIQSNTDGIETLSRIGPMLLEMLLGERAIALNRAACSDASGELGRAISDGGRNEIGPLIANVMSQLTPSDPQAWAQIYVDLLIGDLQIKRAIGVLPELESDAVKQRSGLAISSLRTLLAAQTEKT